ncbi:MAG: hypothetical protein Q8904_09415 [Bacteroidota bacterium]|nr:hypothetical protein [Bacteroidota bacterium]
MGKLKRQLEILLTAVMLISGWGVWGLFIMVFPGSYFEGYPAIPCFFYVMGLILIHVITRDRKENQLKLVNLYMILRFSKVAASVIFAGIYLLFVKHQLRDFSIVFIGYYLLYLGLETYFFYKVEEIIKNKKVDE